jgi:methyl-accepting chemotaxis protein
VMGLGYGVLYIFAIFTTNSILTYTYMFPLFMVLILYMDTKCCVAVFLETLLGNIVCVAYIASTSGYAKTEIPDVEIRIASTILTGAFMIFSEMAVQKVNGEKLAKIKEQADATEKMTTSILQTSQGMIEEISSVTDKMQMMGDSMDRMHNSMGEVSTGSAETAESAP